MVMIEDESAEIKSLTSNYDFDDPQVYWVEKKTLEKLSFSIR